MLSPACITEWGWSRLANMALWLGGWWCASPSSSTKSLGHCPKVHSLPADSRSPCSSRRAPVSAPFVQRHSAGCSMGCVCCFWAGAKDLVQRSGDATCGRTGASLAMDAAAMLRELRRAQATHFSSGFCPMPLDWGSHKTGFALESSLPLQLEGFSFACLGHGNALSLRSKHAGASQTQRLPPKTTMVWKIVS